MTTISFAVTLAAGAARAARTDPEPAGPWDDEVTPADWDDEDGEERS